MNKIVQFLILIILVSLIVYTPIPSNNVKKLNSMQTIDSIQELANENKWIIYNRDRNLYSSRIDGTENGLLFKDVGEEDSSISSLTCTIDGENILVGTRSSSRKGTSIYIINLRKNTQEYIDSVESISRLDISNNGKYIVYGSSEGAFIYLLEEQKKIKLGEKILKVSFGYPAISPDSSKVLYRCSNGTLWFIDMTTFRETEITHESDGSFWNPVFFNDNKTVLSPLKRKDKDYYSLWTLNYQTKTLLQIADIKQKAIFSTRISNNNHAIVFTNGEVFYSIIDSKITQLNDPLKDSGSATIKLDANGKYLLYKTDNTSINLAKTDGTLNIEIEKILNKSSPIEHCCWYNHPPFPSELDIQKWNSGNYLQWTPAKKGHHPVTGYNIYRRNQNDKEQILLYTTPINICQFVDTKIDKKGSYYYSVKAVDNAGIESLNSIEILVERTNFTD